jgi:hypothetical protein
MINQQSVEAVADARFGPAFIRPLYDSYSFTRLPCTITNLLTGTHGPGLPADVLGSLPHHYERVVLLLVDSFGWRFWEEYYGELPVLRHIAGTGVVSKLTSQFPSTTAAHVTCIHTGLPAAQSGVYEWFYYEPQVDAVIAPLLFSFAGDHERNTLQRTGIQPRAILPRGNFYGDLVAAGVTPYVLQPSEYTPSPYTSRVTEGVPAGNLFGYRSISEAFTNLVGLIERGERAYYYLYFPMIDTIAHHYGPESPQFAAEVDSFWTTFEHHFLDRLQGKAPNTLLLITADHGHMATDPRTAIYLNLDLDATRIRSFMRTTRHGMPIVPAGSPRDMFLYIRDEALDEAESYIHEALQGRAEVHRTSSLASAGLFGSKPPAAAFWQRVGNLVILPYAHEAVWWWEDGRFSQNLQGHHGGLTPQEAETLLLALPL